MGFCWEINHSACAKVVFNGFFTSLLTLKCCNKLSLCYVYFKYFYGFHEFFDVEMVFCWEITGEITTSTSSVGGTLFYNN